MQQQGPFAWFSAMQLPLWLSKMAPVPQDNFMNLFNEHNKKLLHSVVITIAAWLEQGSFSTGQSGLGSQPKKKKKIRIFNKKSFKSYHLGRLLYMKRKKLMKNIKKISNLRTYTCVRGVWDRCWVCFW